MREVALFAPLSSIVVERLTRAGQPIVAEGQPADDFFVVAEGEVSVHQREQEVRRLGRAASFGEIGLLDGVPRTASVRAHTDVRLLAIGGDSFVAAVSGHEPTDDLARATVRNLHADDRSRWDAPG